MNGWEKLKTLGTVIAAVLVPIAIAVVGNVYTEGMKEKEMEARYVELAVDILTQPPTDDTRAIREWATEVIKRYSDVPLTEPTRQALIEDIPIYQRTITDDELGEAQSILRRLGLYEGGVTGVLDARTRDALRRFQRENDLPPDGLLGLRTLQKLREVE